MAVYIVAYDLHAPGRNYEPLWNALQSVTHCHGEGSVWLLDVNKTASEVRDWLKQHIDNNDTLFVARLHGNWASVRFECGNWLNQNNRNW